MSEVLSRDEYGAPQYMLINPAVYKQLKELNEHYQKWMIDLFTPKGLNILFKTNR